MRKLTPSGYITTIAGTGLNSCDYGAVGPNIGYPTGIVYDGAGNLFVADFGCGTIWKITSAAGIIGKTDVFALPEAIAMDSAGNFYFTEPMGQIVQELTPLGGLTTIAGTGQFGYSGDGGPATNATLYFPYGLAVDSTCSVLIADTLNSRIRKVASPVTVNPASIFLDAVGQAGPPVSVTVASGCGWSSNTSSPWIDVTLGSGSGSGYLNFSVPANTTGADRTGTLTIAGQTIPVTQRATGATFADVTPSAFYFDYPNLMFTLGITNGCSTVPLDFCPNDTITRGQMAKFLVIAVLGSSNFTYNPVPYFTDVPSGAPFFNYIQKLKELGITKGCSATQFCPNDPVTRDEMAAFIIRARYGSTPYMWPSTPYFTDVPANDQFFSYVQKMAQTGITLGCGVGLYCPNNTVTRGEMAVFVVTGLLNQLLRVVSPYVSSVAPNSGSPGEMVTVTLTGVNTNFLQGTTQVVTAPGISASNITVASPTGLTVQLNIDASIAAGPKTIILNTTKEEADFPNGFTVQ